MLKQIFLNSDQCILSAAAYANKTNEKCVCIPNFTLDHLGFSIEFPSAHFQYKKSIVDIAFNRTTPKPVTEMILNEYDSLDQFINNHSALINFI